MPDAPNGAAPLLAFIYHAETGKTGDAAYRTIVGHREGQLSKPVTDFTLEELLNAQKTWGKKWRSSAAGAPQIIRDTLLDLCKRLDLKAEQKFTPALQDRLAYQLLKQRGYEDFIAGRLPFKTFALALSKEWASLPVLQPIQGAHAAVARGQSYYDGDGLNGATVKPGDLEAILSEVLNDASRAKPAPAPAPIPAPRPIEQHEEPIAPPPDKGGLSPWLIGAALLVAIGCALVAFTVPLPI